MLKHRYIVIFFSLALIGLLWLNRFYTVHWSVYLGLFLLFSLIEFYGAAYIHSNFHLTAICKADTDNKVIALTFDDGPAEQTENILKILEESDTKAAFFCIGNRIKGKEVILQKIDKAGHVIGNHSYSHGFLFDLKNTSSFVNDLELAKSEIKSVIGKEPVFFRPPYGVTTPGLARATKKLKLQVIGWNIRSLDTSTKNKQEVLTRIKQRVTPGSIILLHDTVVGVDTVLKELLIYLKENKYTVVPLTTLIQKKAYA